MTNRPTEARVHSTETAYAGRIVRVEIDRVTLPGGHTADIEIVRHPGSVVLVPQPTPDSVVFVRQYRHAIGRWIWELPAGTLEPGEEPVAAARRECEEEIGLVPGVVVPIGAFHPSPGFCDELMRFFACTELADPPADSLVEKDEDEDLEPRTFTLAEARAMVASGEIVDMKTAVGLALIAARDGR